jgi:hypothetical protein
MTKTDWRRPIDNALPGRDERCHPATTYAEPDNRCADTPAADTIATPLVFGDLGVSAFTSGGSLQTGELMRRGGSHAHSAASPRRAVGLRGRTGTQSAREPSATRYPPRPDGRGADTLRSPH